MSLITTADAAEQMISDGQSHTAATLAQALGCAAKRASGFLYNIRTSKKYQTIESDLPNRTVKLVAINGRKVTCNDLWQLALGINKRPRGLTSR